jgi:hypothetical protein
MTTKPITKANKPLANSRQQAPVVVSSNFFCNYQRIPAECHGLAIGLDG